MCWSCCCESTPPREKYWRFDTDVNQPLPSNFRMVAFKDGTGISASGQFGVNGLSNIQSFLEGKSICVIDLRKEAHALVNGQPITLHHAEQDEMKELLTPMAALAIRSYYKGKESTTPVTVREVMSEEALLVSKRIPYERLQVEDGTVAPDDIIDRLIQIYLEAKAKQRWLHIHCRLGQGRTSFAVAVIMMLEFANAHASNEILRMSHELGGINFLNKKSDSRCPPRYFWKNFHSFCKEARYRDQSWSSWNTLERFKELL